MPSSQLAAAHIEGQRRLRVRAARAAQLAWESLDSYNEDDLGPWLNLILPLVLGSQRSSALLTNQFLASAVDRRPLPVPIAEVTGAAVRNGTDPTTVYTRPFVSVWSELKQGKAWEEAVKAGMDRATSAVQTDTQLSMRATLQVVGSKDDRILGYQRVPDGDACTFCQLIAGRRYLKKDLLPVHPRCGCGVDVITLANRKDFAGVIENDLDLPPEVAIRQHGELGPVVVDARHRFTGPSAIAA